MNGKLQRLTKIMLASSTKNCDCTIVSFCTWRKKSYEGGRRLGVPPTNSLLTYISKIKMLSIYESMTGSERRLRCA